MAGLGDYPCPELRGVEMHYSKKLVSISVTSLPRKTCYDIGDRLDTTGMKVTALYDNTATAVVRDYDLSYDFSVPGETTVTVTYEGQTATFNVCVNDGLFSGGLGTEQYPYLVTSAEELDLVRSYPVYHFKMATDIIFSHADFSRGGAFYNSGTGWNPIGSQSTPFAGIFDGDGHTISGLHINLSDTATTAYAGLFGIVDGATICNLTLQDVDITVDTDTNAYVGGVVGSARNAEIESCHITGIILSQSTQDTYVGGIAGYANWGTISHCSNASEVIAVSNYPKGLSDYDAYAGGILAYGLSEDISACYNIGSVTAESLKNEAYAGGILGENCKSIINCFNAGTVTAKAYDNGYKDFQNWAIAAGISASGGDTISCCYNVGDISVSTGSTTVPMVRGITGYASWPKQITNCYYLDNLWYGTDDPTRDQTVRCSSWDMISQSTFRGFNFGSVWTMGDSLEYPYPVLQGMEIELIQLHTSKTDDGVRVSLDLPDTLSPQDVYLLVAAYDEDGQLCDNIKMYTADALNNILNSSKEITFSKHYSCTVFLTDLSFRPLLDADFVK